MERQHQAVGWRVGWCTSWGQWLRSQGATWFHEGMEFAIGTGVAMEAVGILGGLNQARDRFEPAGQPGSVPYYLSLAGMYGVAGGISLAGLGVGMNLLGRVLCPILPEDNTPIVAARMNLEAAQVELQAARLKLEAARLEARTEIRDDIPADVRAHAGANVRPEDRPGDRDSFHSIGSHDSDDSGEVEVEVEVQPADNRPLLWNRQRIT